MYKRTRFTPWKEHECHFIHVFESSKLNTSRFNIMTQYETTAELLPILF